MPALTEHSASPLESVDPFRSPSIKILELAGFEIIQRLIEFTEGLRDGGPLLVVRCARTFGAGMGFDSSRPPGNCAEVVATLIVRRKTRIVAEKSPTFCA